MRTALAFIRNERNLLLFAAFISVLLSLWHDVRLSVINPDAICYLSSAAAIDQLGMRGAIQLCGQAQWPFYSMIIYALNHLTHLSYLTSAFVIDGVFSLISVMTFILIVRELGASSRVLWFAAAVILLWSVFNGLRVVIIRDHGFWAFYLISVFLLLRYVKKPCVPVALAWSVSLSIATLFRIEGAIFLLAVPVLCLFRFSLPFRQRLQHCCQLSLLTALLGCLAVLWLLIQPKPYIGHLSRVGEVMDQLQHGWFLIFQTYQSTKQALAQYVLTPDSADKAHLILIFVFVGWYVSSVIVNLSFVYALLIFYAFRKQALRLSQHNQWVMGSYIAVNVAITVCFLLERLFLSKRYLIALCLLLLCWVPFALDDLFQRKERLFFKLALFFIFITALGGIFNFNYSKTFLREAGGWLATHVPAKATLYTNDYQLMYYSQHFPHDLFEKLPDYINLDTIAQGRWKHYDYVALRLRAKEEDKNTALLRDIPLKPTKIFRNKRGDRVVIFALEK